MTGGCACGAVRYRAEAPPDDVAWCACRTCQRSVGAPMVAWASFPAPPRGLALPLRIDGPVAWARSSRHADRGFCPRCGTSLFWRGTDGRCVDITLASLDAPDGLTPTHTIHAADARPWAPPPAALPAYAGPGPAERAAPDAVAALDWICGCIERLGLPYRITGGLAARAWGAERPLADIDLELPDAGIAQLVPELAPYVIDGPHRYVERPWDLLLCTLDHHGQIIDLCGGDTCRIHDGAGWRDDPFRPDEVVHLDVLGRRCPVVPLDALRAYKGFTDRDVDRADIALLAGIHPPA